MNQRSTAGAAILAVVAVTTVHGFAPTSSSGLDLRRPHSTKSTISSFRVLGSEKHRSQKNDNILTVHQSTYPLDADASSLNSTESAYNWEEIQPKHFALEETWRETDLQEASQLVSDKAVDKSKEKAATSMTSATMNLVKVILGTGVLALPSGLAAASDHPLA